MINRGLSSQPNDPGTPERGRNRRRLALPARWLAIALGVATFGLIGLYVGRHPELVISDSYVGRFPDLLPEGAAIAIFAMTYLVVAIGRLPGLWLDRAGAALVGASLMVAAGILPLEEVPKVIDFNTIILLLGVMIVVANLRLSGFFRVVNGWIVTRARYPIVLLTAVILVSGVLSAFLVNDTICLVLTPLVLDLVTQLRRNPVPYLLAIAMASNIGSTSTITGNPQNMIIGSLSHIPYGTFAAALSPIAGIGLILTVVLIALAYRSEFWTGQRLRGEPQPVHANRPIIIKSIVVLRPPWWRVSLPASPLRWWRSLRVPHCCSPDGSSRRRSTARSIGHCC
jgi:di/tricarboxylate transporter